MCKRVPAHAVIPSLQVIGVKVRPKAFVGGSFYIFLKSKSVEIKNVVYFSKAAGEDRIHILQR